MSLVDKRRKIVYWDGTNIYSLPNVSSEGSNFKVCYKHRVFRGSRDELLGLIEDDYSLVTYSSFTKDIVEIKQGVFLVNIKGTTRVIKAQTSIDFIQEYLQYYTKGISLKELSNSNLYKNLNLPLKEFLTYKHKEELLLNLSVNFVSFHEIVYPSLDYLKDFLKLSNRDIYFLSSKGRIKGSTVLRRSAIYGSEELSLIKGRGSKLLLCFKDSSGYFIFPELLELFVKNSLPISKEYKLGEWNIGIRSINTLYDDFYLGNFSIRNSYIKGKGNIFQTKKYDSVLSNYIPAFKIKDNEALILKLGQYCYYKGLSLLLELGIKEAEVKLTSLEGYNLFKSLETNFEQHFAKLAKHRYSAMPSIDYEKKQVKFLGNTYVTSLGEDDYINNVQGIYKENEEFFRVVKFLGFPVPSKEDFIDLYLELRGHGGGYKYIDHLGNKYLTSKSIAEAWGITPVLLKKRLNRGWTMEDTLTTPIPKAKSVKDHLNNEYASFKQMCDTYGLQTSVVRSRLYLGHSLESALTTPVRFRSPNVSKKKS